MRQSGDIVFDHIMTDNQRNAFVTSALTHWKIVVQQGTSGIWYASVYFEDQKVHDHFRNSFYGEPGVHHKKMHKAVRGAMDYYAAFISQLTTRVVEDRYTTTAKVELP